MKSVNYATRTERKGTVKASEIAAALRALADKIEMGGKQSAPAVPAHAPAPAPKSGDGVAGVVAFWDVKQRDNGKTMASLKLQTGERFVCFDDKVIQRIDPLHRGDKVVVSLKPWTKKDGTTEFLIAGVTKGSGGIDADEIPF